MGKKITVNGNMVPKSWYHKIIRENKKPDQVAATILADLLTKYNAGEGTEFQLGYKYFIQEYNFTRTQVRDALVRLEKSYLLRREYRTIKVSDRKFNNEVFLILNSKNLRNTF
ncbi:MAG: hypothetical protein HRU35_01000 [Rickettsiaceae bacterium]|nr:hypothetical protein [Rickettsiaceae bacterium]